jgi:hypothetical protein
MIYLYAVNNYWYNEVSFVASVSVYHFLLPEDGNTTSTRTVADWPWCQLTRWQVGPLKH